MGYVCKILADSISPTGHRLTSFEVTFPRIVLAEVNTHCVISKNSASSRAIPVDKRIAAVEEDRFVPEAFGRNQKGMQPGDALSGDEAIFAQNEWAAAGRHMIEHARALARLGVHKQYANRLLEPFSWHTAVITATDWDNFFHLRVNPLAQGEFRKAAELMRANMANSEPRSIDNGQWHTPYVEPEEALDQAWKVSVGRCARVSYLTQNGVRDPAEDAALTDKLLENGHMSPFEHVARPMSELELRTTQTFDISFDHGPILRGSTERFGYFGSSPKVGDPVIRGAKNETITSVRGPLHYSGKLNGWISRRAYVPGEHDILGHRTQETKA